MTGKKSFRKPPSSGAGTSNSSPQTITPTNPSAAVSDSLDRNVIENVIGSVIKDTEILERRLVEKSIMIMHQEAKLLLMMRHLCYCSRLKMTQNLLT